MAKTRLDLLMVDRGYAESRSQAQRMVMAGQVRVNGQMVIKASVKVEDNVLVELAQKPRFVSRGGEKLDAALNAFGLTKLDEQICVDVGASTGGFTDCLLQYGADLVYAVDVGYGQLHWKLRNDPRVITMERTNARYIEGFDRVIDLVTVDASFISLRVLLPVIINWQKKEDCKILALIKPQFEAGRADAARGRGVIRDTMVHRQILIDILQFAQELGLQLQSIIISPLAGPKGNVEFLAFWKWNDGEAEGDFTEELVDDLLGLDEDDAEKPLTN